MVMRTCATCGGITPSPWQSTCNRLDCKDVRRAEIDAAVAAAVRDLQARMRAEIPSGADGVPADPGR